MRDRSDRSAVSDGYVVPIAGLLALIVALMAGVTGGRARSSDLVDAVLPIGFLVSSLTALRFRQRRVTARDDDDGTTEGACR